MSPVQYGQEADMRMACSNASNLKHSHLCSAVYPWEWSQPGCVFTQDCIKIISLCLLLQQTKENPRTPFSLLYCIPVINLYLCTDVTEKKKKCFLPKAKNSVHLQPQHQLPHTHCPNLSGTLQKWAEVNKKMVTDFQSLWGVMCEQSEASADHTSEP